MQDWYIHTSTTALPQTKTPPDFLSNLHFELPQISPEHQDMLTEEITEAEVDQAITDTHEISASGASGQTITLYKPLFQDWSMD
jgi:hypothetical protein